MAENEGIEPLAALHHYHAFQERLRTIARHFPKWARKESNLRCGLPDLQSGATCQQSPHAQRAPQQNRTADFSLPRRCVASSTRGANSVVLVLLLDSVATAGHRLRTRPGHEPTLQGGCRPCKPYCCHCECLLRSVYKSTWLSLLRGSRWTRTTLVRFDEKCTASLANHLAPLLPNSTLRSRTPSRI